MLREAGFMPSPHLYTAGVTGSHPVVLVGLQAHDLLPLLRKGCTGLELARAGHYALALNTPAIVSRLRRQGLAIVAVLEQGRDRYGRRARWVRYRLRGGPGPARRTPA